MSTYASTYGRTNKVRTALTVAATVQGPHAHTHYHLSGRVALLEKSENRSVAHSSTLTALTGQPPTARRAGGGR